LPGSIAEGTAQKFARMMKSDAVRPPLRKQHARAVFDSVQKDDGRKRTMPILDPQMAPTLGAPEQLDDRNYEYVTKMRRHELDAFGHNRPGRMRRSKYRLCKDCRAKSGPGGAKHWECHR
jgi:hypothetical protein